MTGASESNANSVYDSLEKLVREAIESQNDQRTEFRIPFVRQISLTYSNGASASRHTFTRDLTPRGIGLLHSDALVGDTVLVEVPIDNGAPLTMKGRVIWSMPLQDGWFTSGAAFIDENDQPI
ncbi:MAG: PilZ domain-containing protein [Pirellulaceae bacterium]|jgi:hypothetical protein|nr:PilZ domain-containing protein [Pirellulaceae bacterium]MDP7016282.1 PilZ domain-containing protein [Pirellulaceae bacterium]